jgi:hypothetical protein
LDIERKRKDNMGKVSGEERYKEKRKLERQSEKTERKKQTKRG